MKPARNKKQDGNVLFLILIAVALFAGLSYVVTQSTRSNTGSAESEKSTLISTQIVDYPNLIKTSILRMRLQNIPLEDIYFNYPEDFGSLPIRQLIFHPQGGAASYQEAPTNVMADGVSKNWNFNADYQVPGIGTDGAGGNDVTAFLVGVTNGACVKINEKIGVNISSCTSGQLSNGVPISGADLTNINVNITDSYTFPTGTVEDLDSTCVNVFFRKPIGCFADTATTPPTYIVYSVVLER